MDLRKLFSGKDWELMWPFYAFTFFYAVASLVTPFLVVFFQQKSFVLSQIALLFIAQKIGMILFEIPTGVVADLYGRKFSALLGEALVAILWIILPFLPSFNSTLIVFFFIGVFFTLISGAEESWAYDWLKFKGGEKLAKRFYAKNSALNAAGFVIAPLIAAAMVARIDFLWLFVVNGAIGLILVIFMGFFQNEHFVKHYDTEKKTKQLLRTGKEGLAYFKNLPYALFLLGSIPYFIVYASFDIAEQPYLIELGAPLPVLGIFFSILAFLLIFSPMLGLKLSKRFDDIDIMIFSALASFFMMLSLIFIPKPFWILGAIVLVTVPVLDNIAQPIYSTEFQRLVPSSIRATVSSIRSMIFSIVMIVGLYLSGFLADTFGTRYAFLLSIPGILLIPTLLIYKKIRPSKSAE